MHQKTACLKINYDPIYIQATSKEKGTTRPINSCSYADIIAYKLKSKDLESLSLPKLECYEPFSFTLFDTVIRI